MKLVKVYKKNSLPASTNVGNGTVDSFEPHWVLTDDVRHLMYDHRYIVTDEVHEFGVQKLKTVVEVEK